MDCLSNRLLSYVVVLFVAAMGAPSVGVAQELGQVFIRVVNQSGEGVDDLSPNEFAVLEDGVEIEVIRAVGGG